MLQENSKKASGKLESFLFHTLFLTKEAKNLSIIILLIHVSPPYLTLNISLTLVGERENGIDA